MSAGKLLRDIAERMDLRIDKDRAYGVCNEILCAVDARMNSVLITAYTGPLNEIQKKKIRIFLLENKRDYSINSDKSDIRGEKVTVLLEKVFIKAETAAAFAEDLAMYIHQLGVTCSCEICRSEAEFFNSPVKDKVCDGCFEGYNRRQIIAPAQKMKKEKDDSGSYVTGTAGAILGALVGVIPWVLVGMLGFFAAICGFVMTWAAFWGYRLMNGKSKGMILILVVVLLVMTPFAVLTTHVVIAAQDGLLEYFEGNVFACPKV